MKPKSANTDTTVGRSVHEKFKIIFGSVNECGSPCIGSDIFINLQIVLDFSPRAQEVGDHCVNRSIKRPSTKVFGNGKLNPKTVQSQINLVSAPSFLLHSSSSLFLNIQESYLRQLLSRFHGWVPLGK